MGDLNGGSSTPSAVDDLREAYSKSVDARAERKAAAILRGSPHTVRGTMSDIGEAISLLVERLFALESHVAELEQRNAELEATVVRYEGIWDEQRDFHPNTMVTYGGNLWICEAGNSNVRPGTSDDWQLMQKTKARQ